jgi:hypothetical protein
MPDAHRFLFRPRRWVRQIADCVMADSGLRPLDGRTQRFFSVHLRSSPEKEREQRSRSTASTTQARDMMLLSLYLSAALQVQRVHVQTANPSLLFQFSTFAVTAGLLPFATNHTRSEHDSWGGWTRGGELLQTVIAAVNAHIAAHAMVILSPASSMWTRFLAGALAAPHRYPSSLFTLRSCFGGGITGDIVALTNVVSINTIDPVRRLCGGSIPMRDSEWPEKMRVLVACPVPGGGLLAPMYFNPNSSHGCTIDREYNQMR